VTINKSEKKSDVGTNRLYHILTAKSAYLIWKLRCECGIQRDNAAVTINEIINRWINLMNVRLDLDRKLMNSKYRMKAIPNSLIKATCKSVLRNEEALPENCIMHDRVLVGTDLQEDDGRGHHQPR